MLLSRTIPFAAAALLSLPALAWSQTQYTATGDPTPGEQYALELINRARANPTAEGTRLGINPISEGFTASEAGDVGPRPPLAMNATLLSIARAHSQDMWDNNYFGHDDIPPDDQPPYHWPWDRATAAGYNWTMFAENIATGSNHTAGQLEDVLMIDLGYPGRGHRLNLLDVDPASTVYMREIGIGYSANASNKSNIYRDVLTEDFGRSPTGPFLLGVVYDDTNGNGFYDPGEERAGVDIRTVPAGTYYAVSATAGGYSFPIGTSGTVVIQATGGAFGTNKVYKAVTLRGENVKVDFKISDTSIVDTDKDGLPDSWETAHFGDLSKTAGLDSDGDTFTNVEELNASTDPMDPGSKPGIGGSSPPAPTGSKKHGGGCGLTGLEVLVLLALLRGRRLQ
jgi:uncharacterized protein YkwD